MFSFTSPYGVMCDVNSGFRPRRSSEVRTWAHSGSVSMSWIMRVLTKMRLASA